MCNSEWYKYSVLPRLFSIAVMIFIFSSLASSPAVFIAICSVVRAQPSPEVQRRISAAIEAVADAPIIDYTAFVNPFIGTGMFLPPTD